MGYLPNVELYGVAPEEYGPATERTDGRPWDLVIFEGALPGELPRSPILAIAPTEDSPLGDVTGPPLENPGIGTLSPDEPILRYVDLSTTHIAEASRLVLPDWARTIIPGPNGAPLLYVGNRAGLPSAVLAFEPRQSDLPLQVAFPILLANLTGELLGGSAAPTEAVQPGTPLSLTIPEGASGVTVTRPDGSVAELVPGTGLAASVTFAGTDLPGIYTVTPRSGENTGEPTASSALTPRPSATAETSPLASAGASASPSSAPVDPNAPVRFAVDLFDVDESTIAPGSAATIERLGSGPEPVATPGEGATERPSARDELWIPLVLVVLLVLSLEWAVYHRDAVTRIRRALPGRLGGREAGSAP